MLAIMAEDARKDIRTHFGRATSICIAVDESDGRKLVRARCDTPKSPYRFDCVMGILTKKFGKSGRVADEVMEDHALSSTTHFKEFHRRFFTKGAKRFNWGQRKKRPDAQPGASPSRKRRRSRQELHAPTLDEEGLEDYRRKVRVLASDGGPSERRALWLSASEEFPNVDFIIKDMMHCVRIATQKPLHLAGVFEEVFEELINKRHALLPDLSYSGKWKSILLGVQEDTLKMPQMTLQGAMKYVLTHFAFAKQRMDSCADPLAKVCMMLLPISVMLALVSSDERNHKDQRDRAAGLLSKFQPKFVIAMGVSADWGLISKYFLRLFDDGDHDISNSADEEDNFTAIFESVFVNGGVFHKTSASGGTELDAEFITERVRQQSRHKCVFRCGDKHTLVWGPIAEPDLKQLSMETRVAAKTTLDRVHADMAGVRRDFQCFAHKRIAVALGTDAARGAAMRSSLIDAVKSLGKVFRLDGRMLQVEYLDAMPVMLKCSDPVTIDSGRSSKSVPNWNSWRGLLDEAFVDKNFPTRVGPFVELVKLVRLWISIIDGESTVERDFSHVRTWVRAAKNTNESLVEDMAVVKLSGPQESHEIAFKSAHGQLLPTHFVLRCAAQWRLLYGARCGISAAQRKARPKPVARKLTFKNVKKAVLRAAEQVTEQMVPQQLGALPNEYGMATAYGVNCKTFFKPSYGEQIKKSGAWNKRLQRFSDHTQTKKSNNEMGRFGRHSIPKWKARCGCAKTPDFPVFRRLVFMPEYTASAACGAVPETNYTAKGYTIERGVHSCRFASLIVTDSMQRLHGPCPSQDLVICAIYIVAKGLPLTTVACANARGGDVRLIPHAHIVEHVPANIRRVDFSFHVDFKRQHSTVIEAVRNCCDGTDGKWKVVDFKETARPCQGRSAARGPRGAQVACATTPARGGAQGSAVILPASSGDGRLKSNRNKVCRCEVSCMTDLWQCLQTLRRVKNHATAPLVWIKEQAGM